MLAAWLHTEGCAFDVAEDARAARAALEKRDFDLILCDVELPDLDGPELVAAIEGGNRDVPVIFLTGRPTLESAMKSVRLRVVAYLIKPPDLDEMRRLLHSAVEAHRQRRALAASRRRLQEWDAELAHLESKLETAAQAPLAEHLQLQVRQLAALLLDLDRAVARLTIQPDGRQVFDRMDLLASLRRTVQVLEKTRHHFKSKDLGDLRKELQTLLDRIAPEA